MVPYFERFIAFRYLSSKRKEGFISVIAWFSLIGIALGVATLIIVMSVMNGFRTELLTRILGLNGHITVYDRQAPIQDFGQLALRIGEIPSVLYVTPQIQGQAMIMIDGKATGVLVRGLDPLILRNKNLIAKNIIAGELKEFGNGPDIAIGARLAERIGAGPGDKVLMISPSSSTTAVGSIPRMKTFEIVAIFKVGMYEYDNTFAYLPLANAQLFFKSGNSVNALEIEIKDPKKVEVLREKLKTILSENRYALDWKQRNSSFFNALKVERNVMFLILTLIILVAAFNIISSMIMLVYDKTSSIAILRTMGASRATITRIFFVAGISVGVFGTAAGLALGILFCLNIESIRGLMEYLTGTELFSAEIYFLSNLPAEINWVEVAWVVAMALGLTFLASIYPAWRASRTEPAEVLRGG